MRLGQFSNLFLFFFFLFFGFNFSGDIDAFLTPYCVID